MYGDLLRDASFWQFLFTVDEDLARTAKSRGCDCGGRLHGAKYPRKPRGAGDLPEDYHSRLSFCCDRDGCRKRTTPPSVRYLGRKVFQGAIVILVAAMRQGPAPRRVLGGKPHIEAAHAFRVQLVSFQAPIAGILSPRRTSRLN